MQAVKRPALRYHGGKFRLSPWIQTFFPPHKTYVESFGGAAGVLLTKPRSTAEIYNDLDGDLVNFFEVLRDPERRLQLIETCALTPAARAEWEGAYEPTADPVERARRLAIRAAFGYGSAGATKETCGFRSSFGGRGEKNMAHDWSKYPQSLAAVGQRIVGVLLECLPAAQVIMKYDSLETLHYVDPPYVFETRERASKTTLRYYRHEMTDWQHQDLIGALNNVKGMVVLSGYASDLYTRALQGWQRHETQSRKSAHRGTVLATENIWLNEACQKALANVTK